MTDGASRPPSPFAEFAYKDSAAFNMFEVTDTDVDGFVTREELRSFLKRWGMADEAIQGRYSVLS